MKALHRIGITLLVLCLLCAAVTVASAAGEVAFEASLLNRNKTYAAGDDMVLKIAYLNRTGVTLDNVYYLCSLEEGDSNGLRAIWNAPLSLDASAPFETYVVHRVTEAEAAQGCVSFALAAVSNAPELVCVSDAYTVYLNGQMAIGAAAGINAFVTDMNASAAARLAANVLYPENVAAAQAAEEAARQAAYQAEMQAAQAAPTEAPAAVVETRQAAVVPAVQTDALSADGCYLTYTGRGSGMVQGEQHYCATHAAIVLRLQSALSLAQSWEEQAAAYQAATGEMLQAVAVMANGAGENERSLSETAAARQETAAMLLAAQGISGADSAKCLYQMAEKQLTSLCGLVSGKWALGTESYHNERCANTVSFTASSVCAVDAGGMDENGNAAKAMRICPEHTKAEGYFTEMLYGADRVTAWTNNHDMAQMELKKVYTAMAKKDQSSALADLVAFENLVTAWREALTVTANDGGAAAMEAATHLVMEQVYLLCPLVK